MNNRTSGKGDNEKNPLYCHLARDRPPYQTNDNTTEVASTEVLANVLATFDIVDDDGLLDQAADLLISDQGQWLGIQQVEDEATQEAVLYSEAKIAAVLKTIPMPQKGEIVNKYSDIQYGNIHDDYDNAEQLRQVQELVKDAWDKGIFCQEAMPTISKAEPVQLQTKQDFKLPQFVRPKWKPNEKAYLMAKRKQLESFGHLQRSPRPQTSCRITLASKDHGKNIRMCYDGRPVNMGVIAPGRHYANMVDMIEKASKSHKYKSSFDLPSAYSQVPVHEKSRYLLGVTLPDDDGQPQLYEFTSLPFGLNASPAEMLKWLDGCFQDLPPEMRQRLAYYVDDVVISSPTFEQHLADLKAFFYMCHKHGISLHPKKSKILTGSSVEFLGHTCKRGGSTLSERNVAAIQEIPECNNVSDVRHAIGVFSTARRHVAHFAGIAEPMTRLLSKQARWEWGKQQQQAFRQLKSELSNMVTLHEFDPQFPLVIHCDASAHAGGCWLASDVPGKGLQTIAFFSMVFNQKQRDWGAYARESYVLLWSLQKCALYMQSSPHQTTVYSDAHSLQYVHASTRSELNARFLAKVAELRYKVIHIPGKDNIVADGLSRFRMRSPTELADAGKVHALKTLLTVLPPTAKGETKVHVYFSSMKKVAYQLVQDWRKPTNAMTRGQVTAKTIANGHGLTIIHTEVLKQVETARQLIRSNRPFCTLMCIDLVSRIYTNDDGTTNTDMYKRVVSSTKRCMVATNHIWLCDGIDIEDAVALATLHQLPDSAAADDRSTPKVVISDDEELPWDNGNFDAMEYGQTTRDIEQLGTSIDTATWKHELDMGEFSGTQRSKMYRDEHNTWRFQTNDKELKLVVPKQHRASIVAITHMGLNHAHVSVVTHEVRRFYWWPALATTVAQHDKSCVQCTFTRTKIAKLHGLFKASAYYLPRCDFGIDVKRVQMRGQKQQHVLAAICKFSGYVILMKLERRDTAAVVEALTQHINKKTGPPTSITSDHAREFVSQPFLSWCARNGTHFRMPAQQYPQQNAQVESWWRVLEAGLRRLDNFRDWEPEAQQIVFQYNCRTHSTTKQPPFLLWFGGPPNTVAGNKAVQQRRAHAGEETPPSQTELLKLMEEAATAARRQGAVNGNAKRRQVAMQLNKKATAAPPRPMAVGDKVLFFQETSGASKHTADGRPRTFGVSWIPATITDVNKTIYTVVDAIGTRYYRHRSMIKAWVGSEAEFDKLADAEKARVKEVRRRGVEKATATRLRNNAKRRAKAATTTSHERKTAKVGNNAHDDTVAKRTARDNTSRPCRQVPRRQAEARTPTASGSFSPTMTKRPQRKSTRKRRKKQHFDK